MAVPAPMPLISRNVPAFTNDDFSGSFPAAHANNSVYGGTDYWRCQTTPTGNADSGTLTAPVYLAYDLSGVPSGNRGQVVCSWYNDPVTGAYDPTVISNNPFNIPTTYTIDVNPGVGGGSPPGSGWVTKATVTGSNPYHSRQHVINMAGNNWIRINVTAITGSAFNNNCALNMDVHNASSGVQDDFIIYGDSIVQRGIDHDDTGGIGSIIPVQINAIKSAFYPIIECGGFGGLTATDAQPLFATWLALFPGRYVGIAFGTNDANQGGALVTNFQSKLSNMVSQVVSAGKIPIIPHIPYGTTAGIVANGPTVNTAIDLVVAATPTAVKGPDLWAYYQANQSLISGDGIHPTDPAGYVAYRQQWVNSLIANVYTASGLSVLRSRGLHVALVQ